MCNKIFISIKEWKKNFCVQGNFIHVPGIYSCETFSLQEHMDYEIIQSTNPDFNKAIVRVNIFREHRQTIQVDSLCIHFMGQQVCSLRAYEHLDR